MSRRFGPSRGELWFRLIFSLCGLAIMVFALIYRGIGGIAWIEVVLIASVFFGGTVIWTALRLLASKEDDDGL
jgi:hypothetical protein